MFDELDPSQAVPPPFPNIATDAPVHNGALPAPDGESHATPDMVPFTGPESRADSAEASDPVTLLDLLGATPPAPPFTTRREHLGRLSVATPLSSSDGVVLAHLPEGTIVSAFLPQYSEDIAVEAPTVNMRKFGYVSRAAIVWAEHPDH